MRLTLAGVAPDGSLRLTDADGGAYALPVDVRVAAAVTESAPARREPPMDVHSESVLRPRDIQARIRAGESPEQVAAAAHTSLERVLPFAGPVLAEREHVADRAQRSSVRRPAGAPAPEGGPRTLGDLVASRLRRLDVDPTDLVAWDAWRREDGRWSLAGRYAVAATTVRREGTAAFTFDPPGNFVTPDNDDARWLVGDLPDQPTSAPAEPLSGVRRLAAVVDRDPDHERAAHGVEHGVDHGADRGDDDQLSIDAELELGATSPSGASSSVTGPGVDEPDLAGPIAAAALDDDPTAPTAEPPRRRPVRKTRGRASVPSWDEIMFGSD